MFLFMSDTVFSHWFAILSKSPRVRGSCGRVDNGRDYDITVSLNSSCSDMLTFGLLSFEKVWTILSH